MSENLIYYKYNNKEISTPTSEGYLTDFTKTKDWIEWLQKEFEISKEDWKEKQFNIQFKSQTTQPEYVKLFYTNKECEEAGWEMDENGKKDSNMIFWPPIYLHPLMEDWVGIDCKKCGHKEYYNVRGMKKDLKGSETGLVLAGCSRCGFTGGIYKNCIYRVCEDHMGEGRHFWIEAWNKLGVEYGK